MRIVLAIALLTTACAGSSGGDASTAAVELDSGQPGSIQPGSVQPGSAQSGSVDVGGGAIHVVRVPAVAAGAPMTVLFLHGAAFTSQTWVDNGIASAVAAGGFDVVAIDLPGSGSSDAVDLADEVFLAELFVVLGLDPSMTVIVSPSMSGQFSLPALRDPSFADLAGYVPVAPVGSATFAADGPPVEVPALIVWGDGDGSDPLGSAQVLAAGFANAEVLVLADAGHAAYQQQPEAFGEALVEFAGGLAP